MLCKGLVESIRGPGGGDEKSGLRHADYLAIGISSALLGMLYVAGLVGFICYRRRKRQLENVHIKLSAQPSTPVQELGIMRLNPLLQSTRNSGRPSSTSDLSKNVRSHHRSSNNMESSRPVIQFNFSLFILTSGIQLKFESLIVFRKEPQNRLLNAIIYA